MYRNNQYTNEAYEQSYNNEYNLELNPEFEINNEQGYEFNSNYETGGSFENEDESDHEYNPGYEIQAEFNMEDENEYANEFNQEYERGGQDAMELELEYVTNEQELSNWVNEVVVRTNPGLRRTLKTPLGRKAVKQFSKIAFKTLPYIGRKRHGWKRPYKYRRPHRQHHRSPGQRRWYNGRWVNAPFMPSQQYPDMQPQQQGFQDPGMQQPQGFQGPGMQQPPQAFSNQGMPQPSQSANAGGQQQSPVEQDGSFKNFVLDTIKNLSEQIAKGNESIMALKNSMTSSAANNFPAIVQPKADSADPGAPNSSTPPAADTAPKDPAATGEYEWEDNEYDHETNYEYGNETNYEYSNETSYEYDHETDGEITNNESSFNEVTQMKLASELLSVNNEMELDHFLGKLLKKAAGGLSKLLASPQGALLKKALKAVAGKALPILGGVVGGPVGAAVGNAVGSAVASEFFNLELEGLSDEDSEFEAAKAFVRFAGNAAKEAHDTETGNPVKDAEHAMIQSARRFAPGLLRRRSYGYNQNTGRDYQYDQNDGTNNMGSDSGSWYRQGNRIIIQGPF